MKVIHAFKKFIDDNKDEPLVEANGIHLVVINIRCDIDSCGDPFNSDKQKTDNKIELVFPKYEQEQDDQYI